MNEEQVPKEAAPFGFRGLPLLKTFNQDISDPNKILDLDLGNYENGRFGLVTWQNGSSKASSNAMTGSILPPVPFRFKVTTG